MTRILISLSLVLASICVARDWPQFRGPTTQGVSSAKGLPTSWSQTDNVSWRQALPGTGWSSPVCVDGVLYLTAAEDKGASRELLVLAVNARTGKTKWQKSLFTQDAKAPKKHKKNSHASPTPIVDGGQLYVHFGHAGTARLDLQGKVIWKRVISYPPMHGNGGSPALTDDAMIFSCDGTKDPFVIALARDTGKTLWKTPRNLTAQRRFSFCTPLLIEVEGKPQVILPGSGGVVAYNPKTGKEIWWVRYGEGYSVVPRPVYANGILVVCSGFNRAIGYGIRPTGEGDVTETHVAWTLRKGAPLTPSPVVVGDEVYFCADRGILTCVDLKSGKVHWAERINGAYSSSLTLIDGLIYCTSEEGKTTVVRPGTGSMKIVATSEIGERTLASLAVGNGAIFHRTETHLYRIEK
jgi:outer membrane protein assembly factor BamB